MNMLAPYTWVCTCGTKHSPSKELCGKDPEKGFETSKHSMNKKKTFLKVQCPNCDKVSTSVNFAQDYQSFPNDYRLKSTRTMKKLRMPKVPETKPLIEHPKMFVRNIDGN